MHALGASATLLAIAAWEAIASLLFLLMLKYWSVYPWPDRLWMWGRYAWEAASNPIVSRYLLISGCVASLPFILLVAIIARRSSKRSTTDVYGKTEFASREQMKANRIHPSRRPF